MLISGLQATAKRKKELWCHTVLLVSLRGPRLDSKSFLLMWWGYASEGKSSCMADFEWIILLLMILSFSRHYTSSSRIKLPTLSKLKQIALKKNSNWVKKKKKTSIEISWLFDFLRQILYICMQKSHSCLEIL